MPLEAVRMPAPPAERRGRRRNSSPRGRKDSAAAATPDKLLLPTGADLAAQRGPVPTRAVSLAGFRLKPEKAGAMFPVEWGK